ncbi:MAG TPA: LysR substrate-binding domain-containing protein [Microvirga sp.]|jgi:DNA-binding transcriptional LysR family regulator|nr:LysR substrate-binding domain-containing protein [Microvirga sp.]
MRLIETADLHVFLTVVEAGGVTRAAERLHRVQSNVTARIRRLEEDLGAVLFARAGRGLQLTPAGRRLVPYAERLLALAGEARDALQETQARGVLRLGAMESTAASRLPEPLSRFHAACPAVTVELSTGDPRALTAAVLAGTLDAALVAEPVADPRLAVRPVFAEEIVVVARAGHPRIASPRDVAPRTMLAFHPGCPHRKRMEDWFDRAGVPVERVVELSSYHAMLGCAVAGMGAAFLPRSVLDTYTERARLSVHPLKPPFRDVRTLLIRRRDAPQGKVAAFEAVLLGEEAAGKTAGEGARGERRPERARPRAGRRPREA